LGTRAEATEINAICDGNPDAVNFLGKSSISDIPELSQGASVVVGNDTGPSHIAYYSGARMVMVFTDFDFSRAAHPDSIRIASLHSAKIEDISFDSVVEAIGKVMEND
jgi:ADP-heptose:LPS heptosyltransferase